jgi:dCMP deaminase
MNRQFTDYIPPSWDEFFLRGVYWYATKSKDPSSKLGAVIVKNNRPILWGFNGIAKGVDDLPERMERPIKYKYFSHAERNACYQGAELGISSKNGTMYTNGTPCTDCAIAIIQSGIKVVKVHKQYNALWKQCVRERWTGHEEITKTMFSESKVELIELDIELGLSTYIDEKVFVI